jgi:hypothetical protein
MDGETLGVEARTLEREGRGAMGLRPQIEPSVAKISSPPPNRLSSISLLRRLGGARTRTPSR